MRPLKEGASPSKSGSAKKKQTLRDQLLHVRKQHGKTDPRLLTSENPPIDTIHLWDLFMELRMDGPLTYTEVDSWQRLTGIRLLGWEIETLKLIDRVYWKIVYE